MSQPIAIKGHQIPTDYSGMNGIEGIDVFKIYQSLDFGLHTSLSSIYELCEKLTKEYDASHNIDHHIQVFKNTVMIALHEITKMNFESKNRYLRIITFVALLHDTIDDKYCNHEQKLQKKQELNDFLINEIPEDCENIMWCMDHISFSKEKKRGYPACHDDPLLTLALRTVSDADKLEAIGTVGLQRMLDFNMSEQNGTPSTDIARASNIPSMMMRIRAHVAEKLCLLKDNYIHTQKGKQLATPLHVVMMNIVNDDVKLIEFIKTDKRYV